MLIHKDSYIVGVVGATGAVGIELISCLFNRKFPTKLSNIRLFASSRSAGTVCSTLYGDIIIEQYNIDKVRECDFVFLAVSGEFALENARDIIAGDGPIVIDNSSAFRYMDDVPLIIPEINPQCLLNAKLISNPNCTTAIAAVVLHPIHIRYGIKKIIMSTYQAASGAGAEGIEELINGTKQYLNKDVVSHAVFSHPLPFNLIPHIDKFQDNLYTKEEMKVAWETQKIFGLSENDIKISCTAVRIPTIRAHSEAISIETNTPIDAKDVR